MDWLWQDEHHRGVALIMNRESANTLIEWEPINERLIKARSTQSTANLLLYNAMHQQMTEDDIREEWYDQLQAAVSKIPQPDVLLIMGVMDAKTGSDGTDRERAMGREGCGIINANGEKFVNFCLNNNCVIGGTIFQHKEIHKLTWKSPDGRTVNKIDHVVINNKWRRSLKDVHACRGADAGSDHCLVVSGLKLCLRKAPVKHDRQRRCNVGGLKHGDTQKAFVLEVKNQFQKLNTDELDHPPVEERWNQIKATYCTASESALGYLKSTDKTWLTRETWRRIEERKTIKSKILNTKSKRIQERLQKEYSSKDKEIKRSARQDKRAYIDKLPEKAETAAQKGELSTVYRITKQLCRHTKVAASIVKDKDGNALTTEQMQAKRWAEHFTEDPPATNDDLDIATGVPTLQEVIHAIKKMKTGKSPGTDNICIELL